MKHPKSSRARLRPFRIGDAPDVCGIYPMFFVDNAVHFAGGRITVSVVGENVVGFVMWSPAFEPAWFDPGVERWAQLDELHVHPAFHNQGIGTRLVRAAIGQARDEGFRCFYVETDDFNGPARRVYEKAGFRMHNRIVRYKMEL